MTFFQSILYDKYGDFEEASLLLSEGFDINFVNFRGRTPLMEAILKDNVLVVDFLLDNGADVNMELNSASTVFTYACSKGTQHMVRLLINNGADVNKETSAGYTPLIVASQVGREDIVRLLLSKGATNDSITTDFLPLDAVGWARRTGHNNFVEIIESYSI